MKNRIRIVLRVYNAERFLVRTIENIQAQTFQDWELLLVDDGSTDNSRAIMERYESEQIRCFFCRQFLGPAYA